MVELSTARLRLRGWRADDVDVLAEIDADPEVMRYIGDGSPRTREQTVAAVARMRRDWDDQGYGIFAVESRETGVLLGWVGLAIPRFLPEVLPAVEIGYRLGRDHWGRGFATEAAREALRFGFDDAGLDRILSICHIDNHASARVMVKLGMRLDRETVVPKVGVRAKVFAITRGEFDAATG